MGPQAREAQRPDRRVLGVTRAGTGPAPSQAIFIGNLVIVHGTGPTSGVFIYNGAPALGNPPQIAIVPTGVIADPYGNAITSSKILMQGNVITESGGVFRTAAAAPLLQLDGTHNAFLVYDAVPGLAETMAPVGTSDGLGSIVLAGISTYTTVSPFIAIQMFGATLQWQHASSLGGPWSANGASIAEAGGNLTLTSGTLGGASQAALTLQSGASASQTIAAATSPFALTNIAAPSSGLVASGVLLFGSSGHLKTVSVTDGGTYGTERAVFTATGQTVNSLTPATVAGIGVAIPVAAAKYLVRGCIIILQGAGGAGHQGVRFTGPAVSNMNVSFLSVEGATIFNSGVLGALSTDMDSGAIPINTTAELHFDGIITFSAAGSTFGMQADCITSAADTWTLSANSYLELLPL